jgi:hypothetical protein
MAMTMMMSIVVILQVRCSGFEPLNQTYRRHCCRILLIGQWRRGTLFPIITVRGGTVESLLVVADAYAAKATSERRRQRRTTTGSCH